MRVVTMIQAILLAGAFSLVPDAEAQSRTETDSWTADVIKYVNSPATANRNPGIEHCNMDCDASGENCMMCCHDGNYINDLRRHQGVCIPLTKADNPQVGYTVGTPVQVTDNDANDGQNFNHPEVEPIGECKVDAAGTVDQCFQVIYGWDPAGGGNNTYVTGLVVDSKGNVVAPQVVLSQDNDNRGAIVKCTSCTSAAERAPGNSLECDPEQMNQVTCSYYENNATGTDYNGVLVTRVVDSPSGSELIVESDTRAYPEGDGRNRKTLDGIMCEKMGAPGETALCYATGSSENGNPADSCRLTLGQTDKDGNFTNLMGANNYVTGFDEDEVNNEVAAGVSHCEAHLASIEAIPGSDEYEAHVLLAFNTSLGTVNRSGGRERKGSASWFNALILTGEPGQQWSVQRVAQIRAPELGTGFHSASDVIHLGDKTHLFVTGVNYTDEGMGTINSITMDWSTGLLESERAEFFDGKTVVSAAGHYTASMRGNSPGDGGTYARPDLLPNSDYKKCGFDGEAVGFRPSVQYFAAVPFQGHREGDPYGADGYKAYDGAVALMPAVIDTEACKIAGTTPDLDSIPEGQGPGGEGAAQAPSPEGQAAAQLDAEAKGGSCAGGAGLLPWALVSVFLGLRRRRQVAA